MPPVSAVRGFMNAAELVSRSTKSTSSMFTGHSLADSKRKGSAVRIAPRASTCVVPDPPREYGADYLPARIGASLVIARLLLVLGLLAPVFAVSSTGSAAEASACPSATFSPSSGPPGTLVTFRGHGCAGGRSEVDVEFRPRKHSPPQQLGRRVMTGTDGRFTIHRRIPLNADPKAKTSLLIEFPNRACPQCAQIFFERPFEVTGSQEPQLPMTGANTTGAVVAACALIAAGASLAWRVRS